MTNSAPTTGASSTARYISEQAARSREQVERSHTFGAGINSLREELCAVFTECSQAGWDGYNAAPVSVKTYLHAYLFIETLPLGIALPTVGAEPDGHLTLEWHRGPRRTLSVSINPDGDLHFAALFGQEKDYGTRQFRTEVPLRILELMQQVSG